MRPLLYAIFEPMLKAISRSLLSLVFPVCCELCGEALPARAEGAVCPVCEASLPLSGLASPLESDRFHFDRLFSACRYEGRTKQLLCAFKFRRRLALGKDLVRLLEKQLAAIPEKRWDMVAAVPMPAALKRERGFNQAELLARGVARLVERPFEKRALDIKGAPRQQSRLGRVERKRNVERRFAARVSAAGKNVLLVDDILTTGNTASECARALKGAGARSVDVLVVAHGVSR